MDWNYTDLDLLWPLNHKGHHLVIKVTLCELLLLKVKLSYTLLQSLSSHMITWGVRTQNLSIEKREREKKKREVDFNLCNPKATPPGETKGDKQQEKENGPRITTFCRSDSTFPQVRRPPRPVFCCCSFFFLISFKHELCTCTWCFATKRQFKKLTI